MAVWLAIVLVITICDAASIHESPTDYDTIVVGLGASGTTAASLLARAGRRVLGLEAQDRVGGRVHTVPCGDAVVEMGAEWIHGTEDSPTYGLAMENHIKLQADELDEIAVRSDRTFSNMTLIDELMSVTFVFISNPPKVPTSLGDHISKRLTEYLAEYNPELLKDSEFIHEYLSLINLTVGTYEGADDYHDVTTHGSYRELGGSSVMSWGKSGYKTLFQILLNTYKNGAGLPNLTVKLNTEVTQIVWPQEPSQKVVVKTKDGAEYTADNVILTVSVGVLKERYTTLLSPQPPQKKITAINDVSLGVVNKIILVFSKPWWPEGMGFDFLWRPEELKDVPEEDLWITGVASATRSQGCDGALVVWTYGAVARHTESLSEEVLKTKSMQLLRQFLGGNYTIPDPIDIKRSTWFSNPYTRGSYSFDNVKTPLHPSIRADLGAPLTDSSGKPRVLFAGEATNPTYFGTVHGAVNTGKREAARLLPDSHIKFTSVPKYGRYFSVLSRYGSNPDL